MKKIILYWLVMFVMESAANAVLDSDTEAFNITIATPSLDSYSTNAAAIKLNATVAFTVGTQINITNLTFIFSKGTNITRFFNSTVNGTGTNAEHGDFTYTLIAGQLTEGSWSVVAEARNDSSITVNNAATNSSAVVFVVDKTPPQTKISVPVSGSTVVPSYSTVTFEYTPTETNLGNCSLHLDNQLVRQSSSSTTAPNVSSGILNRFTHSFGTTNNSVRVAISCLDLAGNDGTNDNFTFGVLIGATPYAIKQLQAGGGGGLPIQQQQRQQGRGFSVSGAVSNSSTHLEKYGFIYLIAAVLALIVIFRKKFK